MRRCIVWVLVGLVQASGLAAAGMKPVAVTGPKDRQILDAFLRHVEKLPQEITPEYCKKTAEEDAEGAEPVTWLIMPSLRMPLVAYKITADPKYLDMFVQLFDNLRSALTVGRDGYLGWYGTAAPDYRDPNDPDRKTDAVISSFTATDVICDFLSLVAQDPKLSRRYAKQRKEYLDLAENHLVKKHTVRGEYVDLGRGGAIYRASPVGLNARQARLTLPHNKNSMVMHGLLGLYRVTGKDEYMRKAIKLGIRYKHCLTLKDGHYEWDYWDPAGEWDIRRDDPGQWKHWIGPEHRGGYYSLSLSQAVALYEFGLVFDKSDMGRFLKTQLAMCWNGSMANPVWSRVDGTRPPQYTQGEYISEALAPFSEKVTEFLYRGLDRDEVLKDREDSWTGGPVAAGWLRAKLVDYPAAKGGKQVYREYGKRFLAKKENRDFLKALAFEVTPPGYIAPESPGQMSAAAAAATP
jgi:hypothetical protein